MLVIVSSFARFITAMMLPSRTTGDLLAGMWLLLSGQLGAVPHRLIWDNEAGIGRRNRLAEGVSGFAGTLATRVVQLKPFDLLSVIDVADDAVVDVADGPGVRRPRPLVADGVLVGSVTWCSAR